MRKVIVITCLLIFQLAVQASNGPEEAAKAAIRAKKFKIAQSIYEKLAAESPEKTEYRLWVARLLSWRKKYRESHRIYDSVLAADPGNTEALLGKSYAYMWDRKLRKAMDMIDGASDGAPASIAVAIAKINLLLIGGRISEARTTIEFAKSVDRSNPEVLQLEKRIIERNKTISESRCLFEDRTAAMKRCSARWGIFSGQDFLEVSGQEEADFREFRKSVGLRFRKQLSSRLSVKGNFRGSAGRFSESEFRAGTTIDYELAKAVSVGNSLDISRGNFFQSSSINQSVRLSPDSRTVISGEITDQRIRSFGFGSSRSRAVSFNVQRKVSDDLIINFRQSNGIQKRMCDKCPVIASRSSSLSGDFNWSRRFNGSVTFGSTVAGRNELFVLFRVAFTP